MKLLWCVWSIIACFALLNLLQIYFCYYFYPVKFSKTTADMLSPYPLNFINKNYQRIHCPLDECLLILYFDFYFYSYQVLALR